MISVRSVVSGGNEVPEIGRRSRLLPACSSFSAAGRISSDRVAPSTAALIVATASGGITSGVMRFRPEAAKREARWVEPSRGLVKEQVVKDLTDV